jgi:asparagine synthetase B (glutamine-hydrolysing)
MCSIIGCNFEIKDLEYVNHFLKFRGPDHTSVHTQESWQFVQNLLSITGDFTPQPFTSDDGNIVCIFNG